MGPTASLETLGAMSFEDAIEKGIARADKTLRHSCVLSIYRVKLRKVPRRRRHSGLEHGGMHLPVGNGLMRKFASTGPT
jgi:hypothetical protein